MSLVTEIITLFTDKVAVLASWLEEHHNITSSEVLNKWGEVVDISIVQPTIKKVPKINMLNTCPHIFIAGTRAGEKCTVKPKNGQIYCCAHKPKPVKEQKSIDTTVLLQDPPVRGPSVHLVKSVTEDKPLQNGYNNETDDETAPIKKKATKGKKGPSPSKKSNVKKLAYDTDDEILDDDINLH